MKNIRQSIMLIIAGGVLMPFISLPTHRWARRMYRDIEREILSSQDAPPDAKVTEKQIRNSLYQLKTDNYIKMVEVRKRGKTLGFRFELTPKGKKLLQRYSLDDLRIPQPARWDKKWRFVIFDIPEKRRAYRSALRDRLYRLGFFRVQHSVWAHPYPCQKEIEVICELLGLQKYVLVFEAEIKNDLQLRKYFQKRGFLL